jgi:hypothetical protein
MRLPTDGTNWTPVSSGVYFVRLKSGEAARTASVILVR